MEKTVGLGNRMDLIFHNIRIGLFWMDHSLIKANLEKATTLMEEGGKNLECYSDFYEICL